MSPLAEPVEASAVPVVLPEKLLQDGEVIILAIKPSMWFVLLRSLPVVVVGAIAMAASILAGQVLSIRFPQATVVVLSMAVVCVRIVVAAFQWAARLYVLTNLRVMRIRGLDGTDVAGCLLKQIRAAQVQTEYPERLLGVGTLAFQTDEKLPADASWLHLARPLEVKQVVDEAIRRARKTG